MRLTIHGHFYQPPRENPWTGRVPRQASAAPYHDWNERITTECYAPNCRSRVLDDEKRIQRIVDNLESIHFDFGPTLLRWLERHRPQTYGRILEADAKSIQKNGGHGNAIAQAYNHMILPLASQRDRRTQLLWGLRDFEHRFGRSSESIWLPETAVDLDTVRLLTELGIRYLILSPQQARRIRPLSGGSWKDVAHEQIDTTVPYRLFVPDRGSDSRASIDLFFYDGTLSHEISFGDLLRSAPVFADRIEAAGTDLGDAALVHFATDGEVYGHHVPFGDMCLASLITREAAPRGIEFTNYGNHLDRFPPRHEVELDLGAFGTGSSWSCSHGVERWRSDCGCSTGGPEGWNQQWREPLRAGLDHLRDRLVEIFHSQMGEWVSDPWKVRDDYIDLLLSPEKRRSFCDRHVRRALDAAGHQKVWRLLESQHQAMLMFTSCAWFFADLSRLEVRQNLAHAARAIELAQPFTPADLEAELLEYLATARSNIPGDGSGADLWRREVCPIRRRPAHFAIEAIARLATPLAQTDTGESDPFRIEVTSMEGSLADGGVEARVWIVDRSTEESHAFLVRSETDEERLILFSVREDEADDAPIESLSIDDLAEEIRQPIVCAISADLLDREEKRFADIFEESIPLLRRCREQSQILPSVFQSLASHVLMRRCEGASEKLRETAPTSLTGKMIHDAASRLFALADEIGVRVDGAPLAHVVEVALDASLRTVQDVTTGDMVRAIDLLKVAAEVGIKIRRTDLEEKVYDLLNYHAPILANKQTGRGIEEPKVDPDTLILLAELSNLTLPMLERDF